ncbi:MAG: hypothetical protein A2284_09065 [Deltaproteobacteria bacterium RIFOXYA12_FULL_61_11]|nr:MAG: hypothetical protein A2284_09065 [Deltaproteobacteria bacterium RIFOXYA12_FULL_61_11]
MSTPFLRCPILFVVILSLACSAEPEGEEGSFEDPTGEVSSDRSAASPRTEGEDPAETGDDTPRPAPTITALDPANGPVGGGTLLRIKGTGLSAESVVFLGRARATVQEGSSDGTSLAVVVPPATSGERLVEVRVVGQDQQEVTFASYRYLPLLGPDDLDKVEVVLGLESELSLDLEGELPPDALLLGEYVVEIMGEGQYLLRLPEDLAVGTYPLRLRYSDGFTWETGLSLTVRAPRPVLYEVSPSMVDTSGGRSLVLSGEELTRDLRLRLGSVLLEPDEVDAEGHRWSVLLPELPEGVWPLALLDPDDAILLEHGEVQVIPGLWAFTILSVEPSEVIAGRNSEVVLTVRNPREVATVRLGSMVLGWTEVEAGGLVRLRLGPTVPVGAHKLVLELEDGGTVVAPTLLTVRPARPSLVSVSPTLVSARGGDRLVLVGTELGLDTLVQLGPYPLDQLEVLEDNARLAVLLPEIPAGWYLLTVAGPGQDPLGEGIAVTVASTAGELVAIETGAVQQGYYDLEFEVGPNVTSVGITPLALTDEGAQVRAAILEVEAPDGTMLLQYEDYEREGPLGRTEPQTLILPNELSGSHYYGLERGLAPGSYRLRILLEEDRPAELTTYILRKFDEDLARGRVALATRLVGSFFGGDALDAVADVLARASEVYGQVGISLEPAGDVVVLSEGTYDALSVIDDYEYGKDSPKLRQLLALGEGFDELSIALFFVRGISTADGSLDGIAGLSPIPGSFVAGTSSSGIALQTFGLRFENLGPSQRQSLAEALAHELGHFLGLYHTSELDQPADELAMLVFDPLPDTERCVAPEGGTTIVTPDQCPDFSNLMFPMAGGTTLTIQQGQVLHLNPFVQ